MNQAIAFLGLGVMGAPMAANLVKSGATVFAWNRTPNRPTVEIARQAGVTVVSTLREAVESASVIFTCVGDVPDVEAVILGEEGVATFARPHALIVDMSTIGPQAARNIAASLEPKPLRFLDAPVSGGDIGAKKGTLTIMVGGSLRDFTEAQPFLQCMGKIIRLCGEVGSGQAVKLCNQILGAVHMVALCEALQLAHQQHIDPNLIVEVCSTGAAGSWALANLGPKIIQADFAPGFSIKNMLKDLRLVQESGITLPGTELATRLFQKVRELDGGEGGEQGTQAMIRGYAEPKSD